MDTLAVSCSKAFRFEFASLFLNGLPVSWLNLMFYRPQTKSSTGKKQLSQKGRKSRKQESSAEEDDDDDNEDDDDEDEEDTPKRQTRRRGATKVKRCISEPKMFFLHGDFDPFLVHVLHSYY